MGRTDHVAQHPFVDLDAGIDEDLRTGQPRKHLLAKRIAAVAERARGLSQQAAAFRVAPRHEPRMLGQELPQPVGVVSWMTRSAARAASSRPLSVRRMTSATRSRQPANPYSRARASCASRSDNGRALSRASCFACLRIDSRDGRAGRSLDAAITFLHNCLSAAEARLKEGVEHATHTKNRWNVPLPRVGVRCQRAETEYPRA